MPEAKKFEGALKAPAEKGNAAYTQWVSKLWKETAKLSDSNARKFINPIRAHLEVKVSLLIVTKYLLTGVFLLGEMTCTHKQTMFDVH